MGVLVSFAMVLAGWSSVAQAATPARWSNPAVYDPAPAACLHLGGSIPVTCDSEPAPRVAVNVSGATVAAWVDLHDRVRAAVADRGSRFGPATTLGTGFQPTVAMAPDGTATVAWIGKRTLRFARRAAGASFGASRQLVARGGKEGDDLPKAAGQPDGSVQIVYTSAGRAPGGQYIERVRALRVSANGRPGAPVTLGRGGFNHDSVRAAPDGTVVACCIAPPLQTPDHPIDDRDRLVLHRPAASWTTLDPGVTQNIETVAAADGAVLAGTINVKDSGDAGTLGIPGFARAGADGTFGAVVPAPVKRANRGLGPAVAVDGSGRSVLVYQEKSHAAAFSRTAPVYAIVAAPGATTAPARQRLDAAQGYEPAVRPFGTGALAAWQVPGQRWHVAIERNGVFHSGPAPSGLGPTTLGEDFNYNRDMATAGPYAVLAWTASDGSVRVSRLTNG